jgi:hypothetical protein
MVKKYMEKRTWEEKRGRQKTPWEQAKKMRRQMRQLKKENINKDE